MSVLIKPDVPFSLDAAAAFGFGPNSGRPKPDKGIMRLAFVTDDLRHHAGVELSQDADGTVIASIDSDDQMDAVTRQVRRILSLDHPGGEWLAVGERDPVIGRLQRAHAGLRPVLFHSPYEAAVWAIISARRQRTQAATLRTRIASEYGRTFTIAGQRKYAFPLPEQLLALDTISGVDDIRLQRLHGIARRARRQPGTSLAAGHGTGARAQKLDDAGRHRAHLRHFDPAARHRGDRRYDVQRASPRKLRLSLLRSRPSRRAAGAATGHLRPLAPFSNLDRRADPRGRRQGRAAVRPAPHARLNGAPVPRLRALRRRRLRPHRRTTPLSDSAARRGGAAVSPGRRRWANLEYRDVAGG